MDGRAISYLMVLLIAHYTMVVHLAWTRAPNVDEAAHLAAGLYHWQTGRFDVYRVNPPLIRLVATYAMRHDSPQWPKENLLGLTDQRYEWRMGEQLLDAWSLEKFQRHLFWARLAAGVFSGVGAIYLARWAADLWGSPSACAAATLWCFCPNLTSWAATVCPDVGGAALSVVACYYWRACLTHFGSSCTSRRVTAAAVATGLAMLAKATCLLLPLIQLIVWRLQEPRNGRRHDDRKGGLWLWLLVQLGALLVVTIGYRCEEIGWLRCRLGDRSVGCDESVSYWGQEAAVQNEKATAGLTLSIPMPLPQSYVRGLEIQRAEFQRGKSSYWCGRWSDRGWWWYYLAAFSVKCPLGAWLLLGVNGWTWWRRRQDVCALVSGNWVAVAVPFCVYLIVISGHSGFSHHFRYAFPCLPWCYLGLSRILTADSQARFAGWFAIGLFVMSSVQSMPYGHSYFHELVGGPAQGANYLLESNLEWGEEIYDAARWVEEHPECGPVFRAFHYDAIAQRIKSRWRLPDQGQLSPGWYLASAQRVLDPNDPMHVLASQEFLTTIGYGLRVYYVPRPLRVTKSRAVERL